VSERPEFKCFYGGGDLLEAANDLRDRILSGEMDGFVIAGITESGHCGWHWAYRDDAPAPWARLLAATASAQHAMLTDGL
jgi:hypothetical protein